MTGRLNALAPLGRRQQVVLRHVAGQPAVAVPELRGLDELCVTDNSTGAAVTLVQQLLDASPEPTPDGLEQSPLTAADLAAADRDRVLAAAYRATFGDAVAASPACRGCGARFDLDFSLGELTSRIDATVTCPGATGTFMPTDTAGPVRLPVGHDELAVAGIEDRRRPIALLERCLLDAERATSSCVADDLLEAVEAMFAEVAPTTDLVLSATCPECLAPELIPFDIQSYLLGRLVAERDRVLVELHRLASAYGWTGEAILGLPHGDRARLAQLAEGESPDRRGWR